MTLAYQPGSPAKIHPAVYLLLVLLFCTAWASGFTAAKIALTTAPPALFGGIRFIITGTALLLYAAWRGELRFGRDLPLGKLAFLGLLNQAGYQGLAWQGMGTVSAGLATIIASLNPILIAVIAAPLLGERLHWRKVFGLLLGFGGAVFVVRHRLSGGHENPVGVLLVVGALASLVAGTVAFKYLAPAVTLPVAVGVQTLAAGVALSALGLAFEPVGAISFSVKFWLVMAWCVGVMSIGALLLWFWLLSRGTASSASALHFLIPPIGLAMSWLILAEPVSQSDLLGVIPVGFGIWLATRPAPVRRVAPA